MVTERRQELRRHPRAEVSWPVIVATGNRLFHLETANLSPVGAKVRLQERLQEGTLATLHFQPPEGRPVELQAMVWRADADGPAFFFMEPPPEDFLAPVSSPRSAAA